MTVPIAVVTDISPEGLPFLSGNNINKLLPVSGSTVIVKSVPRIPTTAELVFNLIFFFDIALVRLEVNLAVPFTKFKAYFELSVFGSKTNSSITTIECSVILIVVSSTNLMPIRPASVCALS